MMYKFFFLIFVLFIQNSNALLIGEKLKFQWVKFYLAQNVAAMNRGTEDGISFREHIKVLDSKDSFIARAVCIKILPKISFWKIYRLPESSMMEVNDIYNLVSINLSDTKPGILAEVLTVNTDFLAKENSEELLNITKK